MQTTDPPCAVDDPVKPLALTLTITLAAATAAAADDGVAPLGLVDHAAVNETINERDDAGRVRVRREVRLDEAGNYVNHGGWRQWDAAGRLVGQGRYAWGEPTGVWSRWATAEGAPTLAEAPFDDFTGPFLSQATYRDGRLESVWAIFDSDGRPASEVRFRNGRRHGEAVLYTADGAVYRRARFDEGLPTGRLEQRSGGELKVVAEFVAGRRRIARVDRYESGGLRSREAWLGPPARVSEPDDPWRLRLAVYEATGEELRHGRREAWWPNGQPKLIADYEQGRAVGEARWWHENGQLALRGKYEAGLAQGAWSWWREDGSRAATCRYVAGRPSGEYRQWAADGRRLPAASGEAIAASPEERSFR